MDAIVCSRYGKTEDVVTMSEMPKPEILVNDVLIETRAASINPVDYKIQEGKQKSVMNLDFPFIMGSDVSGVIVELGSQAKLSRLGDEVFSRVVTNRFGTFAEFIAVDENLVAKKPMNITHEEAASFPLVTLTAWQALINTAKLKAGQSVLVHAGSGGVGSVAIQIAKSVGAVVTATTSTANVEMVKNLGADVVIDYTQQQFEDLEADYDIVLETLGGNHQQNSFGVVRKGEVLVSIVGVPSARWAKEKRLPFYMPWIFHFLNRKN